MKRCKKCGCTEFTAHQRLYTDIIVDGDNNFLQNNSMDGSISVYEHENPYGPYAVRNTCALVHCSNNHCCFDDRRIPKNKR